MAGFNIKQGDLEPPLRTTLTNADGALIDLSGKTIVLRTKLLTAPFTYAEHSATADPDQVANTGQASYDWAAGGTTVPGDYAIEWLVDGVLTLPTVGYNRYKVWPKLADDNGYPIGPLVTLDDIEVAIGRALTAAEAQRALQLVDQATATLETYLQRDLVVRTRTDRVRVPSTSVLWPHHGPVVEMLSTKVGTSDASDAYNDTWQDVYFPAGEWVECTYVSGTTDPTQLATAAAVLLQTVARTVMAPTSVATGLLAGYSVEGTSINYGPVAGASDSVGRIAVADLSAVEPLRRRVVG